MIWKHLVGATALVVVSAWTTHQLTASRPGLQDPQDPVDQEALFAEMVRLGTPGPQHEKLQKLEGSWHLVMHHQMEPGGEAATAECDGTYEPMLGGRFLLWKQKGVMFEMPMEARMILGYDNLEQKYTSLWMDSWSTGMYFASGTADDDGVITQHGVMKDAMTPKGRAYKTITKIVSNDQVDFEMWEADPSGALRKTMWLTYTRK